MPASTPIEVPPTDDPIRAVVIRLSRPNRAGGSVIERAAIMAAGGDATAILEWILAHDGQPETAIAGASGGGLHGARFQGSGAGESRTPLRYVLPAGTLG
jgi:hypothetical protein